MQEHRRNHSADQNIGHQLLATDWMDDPSHQKHRDLSRLRQRQTRKDKETTPTAP
jgi:hypothetical protein